MLDNGLNALSALVKLKWNESRTNAPYAKHGADPVYRGLLKCANSRASPNAQGIESFGNRMCPEVHLPVAKGVADSIFECHGVGLGEYDFVNIRDDNVIREVCLWS